MEALSPFQVHLLWDLLTIQRQTWAPLPPWVFSDQAFLNFAFLWWYLEFYSLCQYFYPRSLNSVEILLYLWAWTKHSYVPSPLLDTRVTFWGWYKRKHEEFVCTFEVYKVCDDEDDYGDGGNDGDDVEYAEYSYFFSKSTLHLSHPALSPGRLTPWLCQPGSFAFCFMFFSTNRKYIVERPESERRYSLGIYPPSSLCRDCLQNVTIPFSVSLLYG